MVKIVDDFGDGDISEYVGDKDEWVVSNGVLEKSLSGGESNAAIASTSGLPNYPDTGDVYAVEIKVTSGGDEDGAPEIGFGSSGDDSMYLATVGFTTNEIRLRDGGVNQGGTGNGEPVDLAVNSADISTGVWYDARIYLGTVGRTSGFVFTKGEPITIGSAGDGDVLHHKGTEVRSDKDASGFVNEEGAPLAGGSDIFTMEIHDSPSSTSPLATVSTEIPDYDNAGNGIGWRSANASEESERFRNARIL
jgi:hypothetical protein